MLKTSWGGRVETAGWRQVLSPEARGCHDVPGSPVAETWPRQSAFTLDLMGTTSPIASRPDLLSVGPRASGRRSTYRTNRSQSVCAPPSAAGGNPLG